MRPDFTPASRIFALAVAALAFGASPAAAKEPEIGGLRLALDERTASEPLYHYRRDACDPHDLPDVPARAFRDAQGKIRLLATNFVHRALVGDSFASLRKLCDVVYRPAQHAEPSLYDDKAWIQAVYTLDGITVHALLSADYHEYRHSKNCPFGADTNRCWYNAITAGVSTDGGHSFRTLKDPPAHYVAGPQMRYDLNAERSVGFFTTSNVLHYRGHYYALVYTGGGFAQQRRGVCVLRTATMEEPGSWRAWDGTGYEYAFADPSRGGDRPDDPGCRPVSPSYLNGPLRSVLLHKPTGLFVGIMLTAGSTRETRDARGVYYTLSRDLVEWSRPQPLFIAPTRAEVKRLSDGRSEANAAIDYPSLIDHASPGDNFEFLAGEPYLYYVELPVANGKLTGERWLVRRRLTIVN
jgi:hypothetical protein